jgi:hypothetical protein
MIGNSGSSTIGSGILLASVGVTIWQCIVRTDDSPWYGRVGLTVVAMFVVGGFVGAMLDIAGLDVGDDADATDALRDELSDAGYVPAEIDCVEAALIHEYGSVDAVVDAADVTPSLVAMMTCKGDVGMDAPMIDCWADELVEHFDIDGVHALTIAADAMSKPEHRRFAAVTSMICQGLSGKAASCVYDAVTARHPEMIGDGAPGATPEQQGWLLDAARDCGVS